MKLTLQDDQGELYDVEFPAGADLNHVMAKVEKEVGRPMRQAEPPKKDDGKADAGFLEIERGAHGTTKAELERVRSQMDGLSSERDELVEQLAAERTASGKLNLSRLDTVAEMREAKAMLFTSEKAHEVTKGALAKAEAKCADLTAQLRAAKAVVPVKTGWVVDNVRRGESGLIRGFELVPK